MAGSALIHIGVPKSGTTSIQRYLRRARHDLGDAGFVYPAFLGRPNHVQFAAFADENLARRVFGLADRTDWERWRSEFRKTFEAKNRRMRRRWIISSEHIGSHLTHTDGLGQLCELFTECGISELEILLYVRRQDQTAAASHAQWTLDGQSRRFDIDRHIGMWKRYDFRRMIEAWSSRPEVGRVNVCLYPDRPGMPSLIDGLCSMLGIRPAVQREEPWLNRSLDNRSADRLRRANAYRERMRPELYDALRARIIEQSSGQPFRMSADDARAIMTAYQDSNAWTLEQVAPERRVDGYFDPPAPTADATPMSGRTEGSR